VQMIKAGRPVFFGCDVGQFSNQGFGIMDTALYEYEVRALRPVAHSYLTQVAECIQHHPRPHQSRAPASEGIFNDTRHGHLRRASGRHWRACALQGGELVGGGRGE
jgi:hypothetical protein